MAIGSTETKRTADLSSELRIKLAFQRRCLAYDQADLIDYQTQWSWIEHLFTQLARSPPDGYQAVTMKQALEADKQLWFKLAELTRNGINKLGRVYPLVEAFPKL